MRPTRHGWALALVLFIAVNHIPAAPHAGEAADEPEEEHELEDDHELEGDASWYAGKFQGRTTASGEVFDTNEMTAAHKTLPFGTIVEVTHRSRGTSVTVRINDRGPFVEGRVIDLSRAAADALSMTAEGVAPVTLRIVELPDPPLRRIQVAAFSDQNNAQRLRNRLREEGIAADVEPTGTVYRVVVPEVPDDKTKSLVERLRELGHTDVLIRTEP
jgi:rare lipoprotein A